MEYIVTALDKNKGYRCQISVPLPEEKAKACAANLILMMNIAIPEHRTLSDIKIEMWWIETDKQLPNIGDNVEYSEDGVTVEGTMDYTDRRICMMAGIAGGHGYFGEGFATDGYGQCEKGLICDKPKYWRLSKNN